MPTCEVMDIGRADYDSALNLQQKLLAGKLEGDPVDYLILVEHDPVVTIGRRGSEDDVRDDIAGLRDKGIQLRETGRGGAATYHGPGQLVGYPIMDLRRHGRDVHRYLRRLEKCIIETLEGMGIDAVRSDGLTGVWTRSRKIASIGIAVRRWITYHGFAINVSNDLSGFEAIIPCGMADCRMASISSELGKPVSVEEFARILLPVFGKEFGYN